MRPGPDKGRQPGHKRLETKRDAVSAQIILPTAQVRPMAEAIKSVLLVDYDSIHRSLAAGESAAAERLAQRLGAWIGALEAGSLFADKPDAHGRRRVLIRRCYADPANLGDSRAAFLSNGFQVVDCPPIEGREHDAATIHIVLDCIDAIEHPTGYEEFILLSAGSDLSPLLIRLRAHNRNTAIYATMATADSYRAIADAVVEEPRFIAVLLSDDELEAKEEEQPETRPADRSEIEALARKVSSATNVPLFAPRTFADLFRHLVEEIAENGYHFQTTAENVATRMADAGRNVSRRQVVFVVKGLALKGHVFSTGDTPERLADVFREQVLYLAENAGLELDDNERNALSSWIVGQVPAASGGSEAKKSRSRQDSASEKPSAKAANTDAGRDTRKKPTRSADADKPREPAKSADQAKPATSSSSASTSKPKATSASQSEGADEKPAAMPASSRAAATATESTREKPAPVAESRSAASPAAPSRQAAPVAKSAKPEPAPAAKRPETDESVDNDVESSILAAIAEAVDVLVEDSGGKSSAPTEPRETRVSAAAERPTPPPKAEVEDVEPDDVAEAGDDIGDEIQRIIASYSRNRSKGEQS